MITIDNFPGDKSISHRILFFSSMKKSNLIIKNLNKGYDVLTTINILKELGKTIKFENNSIRFISEKNFFYKKTDNILNCQNSGTTLRLLTGILSGLENNQYFLTGDKSLCNRSNKELIENLEKLNSKFIFQSNKYFLPYQIIGSKLTSSNIENVIYSAQTKSALILASLISNINLSINNSYKTRDHTERLLKYLGNSIKYEDNNVIKIFNNKFDIPDFYEVPGDTSSLSFLIFYYLMNNKNEVLFKNILLNEYRTGFIIHLKKMGANIDIVNSYIKQNEVVGDILLKPHKYLINIDISKNDIPKLIDEIPIICYIACKSMGNMEISGISNLKNKESDRINNLILNFKKINLTVDYDELNDKLYIYGNQTPKSNQVYLRNDHRFIMLFKIIKIIENLNIDILDDLSYINISFPEFNHYIP